MLTIPGPVNQHLCDGLSRRNFIKLGSLGLGLTLSDLFALEASSTARKQNKSLILIYLVGGPPHQDMFDLKPNAPREIAGEFKPIQTNVSGSSSRCHTAMISAPCFSKMAISSSRKR